MTSPKIKYVKCQRCELNYIEADALMCSVCEREIRGETDDFEDDLVDLCPFCEKNALNGAEEACEACMAKHWKKADDENPKDI